MKKILITIDTEGDNLWKWKFGDNITTENSIFLPRFQEICEKYGFKPTYLTNYEMANDDRFVSYFKDKKEKSLCEIGMHLHAWNTPPGYNLNIKNQGAPYLIEYPENIMEAKIATMTKLLEQKFGTKPISHRAGRWAINDTYFKLLDEYNYKIDCSVTPGISWKSCVGCTENFGGIDYSLYSNYEYIVSNTNILELPVTIKKSKALFMPPKLTLKKILKTFRNSIKGQYLWLRPNGKNLKEMLHLIDIVRNSNIKYIMFIIHSSELMPGGSPTFKNSESIEVLYNHIEKIFSYASNCFEGITLENYYKEQQK